jgi:hypothetical protein
MLIACNGLIQSFYTFRLWCWMFQPFSTIILWMLSSIWENVFSHNIVCIHDHSSDIQECLEICCQQLSHLYKQGLMKGFHSEMIRVVFWLVSWYVLCGNIYESPLSLTLSAMFYHISTSFNRLLLLVAWQQLFLLHLPYKSNKCFLKKYLQVCSIPFFCVEISTRFPFFFLKFFIWSFYYLKFFKFKFYYF